MPTHGQRLNAALDAEWTELQARRVNDHAAVERRFQQDVTDYRTRRGLLVALFGTVLGIRALPNAPDAPERPKP